MFFTCIQKTINLQPLSFFIIGAKNKNQMMIMIGMVQGLVVIIPQILSIDCQNP
jgi:hypothetical protein